MRKLKASTTIYMIFSIFIILALCAFAVDLNIVYTTRSELQTATEEIALAKAMGETTENALKFASYGNLKNMTITNESSDGSKYTIETQTLAMPYFTAVLGISGIRLNAKAIAQKKELTVDHGAPGQIKWLNASTMYESDIITSSGEEKDSYIQYSIDTNGGNRFNASYSYTPNGTSYNTTPLWETISINGLNLGPGGYITIKMPVPILDKPGDDFSIEEAGDFKDGYKVYAGIDKDSNQPYINADKPQGGVYWVELTGGQCLDGIYSEGNYYCSATFDIAQDGLSMVKYLLIVDDNEEKGCIETAGSIITAIGEAATVTSGADIKNIKILNYVTLVKE